MIVLIRAFVFAPLLAAALLILPGMASAHGEAVLTFSATTTEGNIVDVDVEGEYIEADTFTRMDFALFQDAARTKDVDFTDMWVRIIRKDGDKAKQSLFAGPIAKPEFGGNGFAFVFPEGGTYTLSVRYNDANKGERGETVGEAELELNVLRSSDEDKFSFDMKFWVGLVSGIFATIGILLPFLVRKGSDIGKKTKEE